MQKIAVVHFPKIDDKEIEIFREKYDPSFKIIAPHITIIFPISEISERQLIEHIESVANSIKSFPIHLNGLIKTFDNCLFLQVKEGREIIIDLHKKLYSGILSKYIPTDFPFEPHITLGNFNESNSIFEKAYNQALQINFNFKSNFDNLSIIKGDGLNPAILLKTIPLQK